MTQNDAMKAVDNGEVGKGYLECVYRFKKSRFK